jgi:signal transduction histidine kinase/CheY-like chemotaxis protein
MVYVGGGNTLGRLEPDHQTGELHFRSLADRLPEAQRGFASVGSVAAAGDTVHFGIDGATLIWRDGAFGVQVFPGQRPAVRQAHGRVFCHVGDQLLRWAGREWEPFARDARLGDVRRVTLLPRTGGGLVVALDDGRMLQAAADGAITEWPTAAATFLRAAGIRNGRQLPDGSYVLSTAGEGLLFLAGDGAPQRRLTAASGLAHDATYGVHGAPDGLLWVETANGLSVLDPLAPWTLFDRRNGRPDTIGGEPVRFEGALLLAMSDIPPLRLRPAPDALGVAKLESLPNMAATRLANFVRMHGRLLSGSERGVVRLDEPQRILFPTASQIEDILPLQQLPEVLVVGRVRGAELVRIAPDFSATPLGRVPDFEAEVTNIREAPERTVWIGTTAGQALRLRLRTDGTLAETTRFGPERGLPAGAAWVKVHAGPGGLIVCVRDAVLRLDPTGERLVPDPRFARYRPSGVNTLPIESDDAGRFWFQIPGGEGGFQVGCLDTRGGGESRWTLLPPALSAALGFGGAREIAYLPERGREFLWISGTRSTVRLDLSASAPPAPPPGVVIREIEQGAQLWNAHTTARRIPFSREPLRLRFASPGATLAPVTYETRLIGYDTDWSPAASPEVTFTNLIGGPFTLEVRARDAQGRTGEIARATFSVSPPWHRTPGAYTFYGLVAAGLILGFVRWRLGRVERERRRLEALVATRTAELATARDAAESANRAKSAFLAAMSHELRTPLNGVIGYAQILQADPRLAPDQHERVRIVQHSGEHLLRMINDVLDLAKIEAGKIELRPAPFSLGDLLRDIAASHAPAAARKGLAFTVDTPADLPAVVLGDAQKLRQVLDNLIGNAIKFTTAGGFTLAVRAAAPDPQLPTLNSQLVFTVTDTGVGIAPEDQARLFQPFEQADATRGDAPGTGLGLAISRALVDRMGGTITLTSEAGRGSAFTFALPLPAVGTPPDAPDAARRITGYEGAARRILVVDDHAINRRLVVDLLAPLGFTCGEFASGEEALARLESGTEPWPDLLVLDVRMKGLDGLAVTRRLRAMPRGGELKVLLMSASVLSFDTAEGRRAGADDFLAKPFRAPELLEKIACLLDLRWRELQPAASLEKSGPPAADAAVPPAALAGLREALAHGDLDEFRRQLAVVRAAHPAFEARWSTLDAAAAAFHLSRLRELLEQP